MLQLIQKNRVCFLETSLQFSPLFNAIPLGQVDILDYLLKKGASLDCPDNDGDSILIGAVKHNANEAVRYLFENHLETMKGKN